MGQALAAAETDRLPWLEDEATPPRKRHSFRELGALAIAVVLVIAGVSYWMGATSWEQPSPPAQNVPANRSVPMRQPGTAQQPAVVPTPVPEVRPERQAEVPIARPRIEKRILPKAPTASAGSESTATEAKNAVTPSTTSEQSSEETAAKPKPTEKLAVWPATQSRGAHGRIVRIGAFGTRQQAKLGWRYMVRAYPAIAHLPATVVGSRNSRGRHYYRFQIGTTSQAHSEVLCQRMDKIHFSCAVVGLAWRPKGVER